MKNFLLFSFLILSGLNCKKSNDAPSVYFNCLIDGKYMTYVQPDPIYHHDGLTAIHYDVGNVYEISGDDVLDLPYTLIKIEINNTSFPSKDTILLSCYGCEAYAQIDYNDPPIETYTNDTLGGRLIFTKRETHWLQGTFYFDAPIDSNKIVHVTNGKFSIKL